MIKSGVRLHGMKPQMAIAYFEAKALWAKYGYPFCVTAGIDGEHSEKSRHWDGAALDFRTWKDETGEQLPMADKQMLAAELQTTLGEEFYVHIEATHIHVQYTPLHP